MVLVSALLFLPLFAGCGTYGHASRNIAADENVWKERNRLDVVKTVAGVNIDLRGLEGWKTTEYTSTVFVAVRLVDRNGPYTTTISVRRVFPPASFNRFEDFRAAITEDLNRLKEAWGPYEVFTIEPGQGNMNRCVKHYRKKKREDQKLAPGKTMYLEDFQFMCQHPAKANLYVNLHYSEQYPIDRVMEPAIGRSVEMFKRLEFSK